MKIRKPNRVTTPKWAVLNGARASHASMPRVGGRWRLDVARVTAHSCGGPAGCTRDGTRQANPNRRRSRTSHDCP
jgi:hypothetical protein